MVQLYSLLLELAAEIGIDTLSRFLETHLSQALTHQPHLQLPQVLPHQALWRSAALPSTIRAVLHQVRGSSKEAMMLGDICCVLNLDPKCSRVHLLFSSNY